MLIATIGKLIFSDRSDRIDHMETKLKVTKHQSLNNFTLQNIDSLTNYINFNTPLSREAKTIAAVHVQTSLKSLDNVRNYIGVVS